jgi:hypothetical protein
VADVSHKCVQLRWQQPPGYSSTPVQRDDEVQEVHIPELSQTHPETTPDVFEKKQVCLMVLSLRCILRKRDMTVDFPMSRADS